MLLTKCYCDVAVFVSRHLWACFFHLASKSQMGFKTALGIFPLADLYGTVKAGEEIWCAISISIDLVIFILSKSFIYGKILISSFPWSESFLQVPDKHSYLHDPSFSGIKFPLSCYWPANQPKLQNYLWIGYQRIVFKGPQYIVCFWDQRKLHDQNLPSLSI